MVKRKTVDTLIREGKTPAQANKMREQAQGLINKENKVSEMKGSDIQVIQGPNGVAGVEAFMKKFTEGVHAEYYELVEIDHIEFPEATVPNDTFYADIYAHTVMESADAWDINTGSSVITVAICDTGFDKNQEDLQNFAGPPYYNAETRIESKYFLSCTC